MDQVVSTTVSIVILMLIFGFLVFIHEAGHFILAKLNGVFVEEFAFGFGPKIVSRKIGDTLYRINLLPLGGYVKMLGDEDPSSFTQDESFRDNPGSYLSKTVLQKISIVVAGPAVNFVAAMILFFFVLLIVNFKPSPMLNIVDYNFIGAEQDSLVLYNHVMIESPLYVQNPEMPTVGIIYQVNGRTIGDFNDVVDEIKSSNGDVSVSLLNPEREQFDFIISRDELLSENNPLGISLVNQQFFTRYGFSEYEGRGSVFYSDIRQLINESSEDNVPDYGVIIEANGEEIQSFEAFSELIDSYEKDSINLKILDLFSEEHNITVNITDQENFEGLFYAGVVDESAASIAGLPNVGFINTVDGNQVTSQEDFVTYLTENENGNISIELTDLEGITEIYQVELGEKAEDGNVKLGIYFAQADSDLLKLNMDVRPVSSSISDHYYLIDYTNNKILSPLNHTLNITFYQLRGLGQIFDDALSGNPSLLVESVGSPIKVGEVIESQVSSVQSQQLDLGRFLLNTLELTALLSATLAFMNMLPIPLVDGGQFVLLVIEGVRGRPMSAKKQELIGKIGFIFLIGFSVIVLLKDLWQVILSKLF